MLLLGLISIFQIIALPGLIIVSIFKIKTDSPIQKWLYIFSFSLFTNYGLITILTLLHVYTLYILWAVLIIELLILIIFFRNELTKIVSNISFRDAYIKLFECLKSKTIGNRIIIIVSGSIVLFYVAVLLANIGTVFYYVDTVNNYEWNSWAIDFANNILPKYSSHFPQLLPANWSICYVMIGKIDVHFFPKTIMPLFFLGNILIFIDLAYTKRNQKYLIGLIIYGLFSPIIYSLVFIADGNADLPVSFFAFLTFYSFLKIEHNKFEIKSYLLTFLFASMAAATKLAGFYTFAITGFVLGIMLLMHAKNLCLRDFYKIVIFIIGVCSMSLFWYLRTPNIMYSGLNQPQYLSPEGYKVIFMKALKLMYYNWGLPVFAFFIITIASSLFYKKFRYITLIMVVIPTIIWMFKFSADFRNLSFVVPFMCVSSAFGLYKIIDYKKPSRLQNDNEVFSPHVKEIKSLKIKEKFFLILTSSIAGVLSFIFFSDKFYLFLLSIYKFINRYYFQSNRIVYFIEYGLLLHVDYYQRVLIVLSIILIIVPVLIFFKIRIKIIIIFFASAAIFLNFTFIKEGIILKHQVDSFNKVDARNYYEWLNTIVAREGLHKVIYSNFKDIINDKIPKRINFEYIKNVSAATLQNMKGANYYLFLKLDILNSNTRTFIKSNIYKKKYELLLEDNNYIFFIVNPL